MRGRVLRLLGVLLILLGSPGLLGQDLVISEILAVNESTLRDQDGDFSDYVEIYNAGTAAADMDGWTLSDDPLFPSKWRFPAVTVPPGGFLLVFASDKDRRDPGSELHLNFKLQSRGEYLGLFAPDLTEVFAYGPYPPQVADFSWGLEMDATLVRLVETGAAATAWIPANGSLGLSWTQPDFDDSGWLTGRTGAGYDRNADYRPLIALDLRAAMEGVNTTAYVRIPFTLSDPAGLGGFRLRLKYDDGFRAYLNGALVASANAPPAPDWDSSATALHDDSAAVVFAEFSFSNPGSLVPGTNVLAIHGLNDNLGSSDFLVLPELDGTGEGTLNREVTQYFHQPTPGAGNVPGYPGISETPLFSLPGTVFTGSLTVTLSVPSPEATIRLTTDGSEPDQDSAEYTGPLELQASTLLRARGFEPGLAPGPIASQGYIALDAGVRSFSSDIPLVLVDNFGAGTIPENGFQAAFMAIFEPGPSGRVALTDPSVLETRIGIRIRGSSTLSRPKKAYRFEAWDEKNNDQDIEPLGLPREADWILYGAYNFDLALMRNAFIYELSNQVGRYATRSRFCEVFVNTGGGALSQADYAGVYSFMESIKRGPDRVDVEPLTASVDSEPEISGGYMWKIDRLDPGDSGFSAGGQRIGWVYPKEDYVTPQQAAWVTDYINRFVTALQSANFRHPTLGYAPFIDVDSWIDHHILNVLPMNVDALRLSAYFFKKRNGPIEFGPIWDFDRSMQSTDGRDDNPFAWRGTGDATDYFNYPWWGRLFADPDFWQRWKDRWHELRQDELSAASMSASLDGMRDEIAEAAVRNFQKWPLIPPSQFPAEVNRIRTYLTERAGWIDSQFLRPPVLSSPGGPILPGFELRITGPGAIYTTADGSDPRAPGGAVSGRATLYSGPLVLEENARVVARIRESDSNWSAPAVATFVVTTPRLVVSEVMYNPPRPHSSSPFPPQEFEFIEVLNAGDGPLDLKGFHFFDGVEFTFPQGPLLEAGEYVVVVKNLEAFATRYNTAQIRIAGQYAGYLENGGELLGLEGPLKEPILHFEYSNLWYPVTDGDEGSLTLLDPFAALETWEERESWLPSSVAGGTPGQEDLGLPRTGGRQRIGDSNQDGALDLADAVSLLARLFGGGGGPLPCEGESVTAGGNLLVLDTTSDAAVNLTDVIYLLSHLFRGGPPPVLGTGCVRVEGCPNRCF